MAPATSYMSGNCDGKCKNINVVYVSGLAKNSKKNSLELRIHQNELNR